MQPDTSVHDDGEVRIVGDPNYDFDPQKFNMSPNLKDHGKVETGNTLDGRTIERINTVDGNNGQ